MNSMKLHKMRMVHGSRFTVSCFALFIFLEIVKYPAHRAGHLDSKEVSITLARLDPAYKAGLTACILLSDSEMREGII